MFYLKIVTTKGIMSFLFILQLLFLSFHFKSSLAYSLKNCTILYQDEPTAKASLDCADRKLETVPDDIPKDVVSLQLWNNLLEKINKEDFCGMSKLISLDLTYNKIAVVEDGSFSNLISLNKLSLASNRLTNLTNNMFQSLSNLVVLDLSDNLIQIIHEIAIQDLIRLKTLDLSDNNIREIVDIKPLFQLPMIQKLSLDCNQLSSFETKDLPLNFSSTLEDLSISSRNLKLSITSPIFSHIQNIAFPTCGQNSNLTWIIPDKTFLSNITQFCLEQQIRSFEDMEHILQSLESLSHLRLNYLNEQVRARVLTTICKIPTLRRLDLSKNVFAHFTLKLSPCFDLTELDLSSTYITELPKGSIHSMKKLQSLDMSNNELTTIPYDIRTLSSLEILSLEVNAISELTCEDFLNTTHLKELSLFLNRITKLPECVFQHLTELKILNVGQNMLQTFGDTFKIALQKLETLDISNHFVAVLNSEDFKGLSSLKYLRFQSDHILMLEEQIFQGLKNLESLFATFIDYELNFTELQHLENLTIYFNSAFPLKILQLTSPEEFIQLRSLKSLTVISVDIVRGADPQTTVLRAMNHLEYFRAVNVYGQVPDVATFQFNPKLKTLIFAKADFPELEYKLFLPIQNLQNLEITESKLKSLDFLVQANLSELRYLKLTDNGLVRVNETVFQSVPSLIYLDLSNNTFTCDCSNSGFIYWIKNNKQTQVVNAHQYKCAFPLEKRGTLLLDFDIQSCWDDGRFLCFIFSTCLVLLTLLTSFIYNFLRWHLIYTFHLFLAFLYDTRKRRKGDPHQFDAFVSYNIHDEDWVYREMLPVLEREQGWKLCLHHRDFQPGKPIIENITDAIYGSRKTICVISRHYLQSEWCSREIQMASFRLFDEQKDVLILLFLEEIPTHHLSPYYRMRKLVKKRTYLSWPQAAQHPGVFWQNVQRALQTGDAPTENMDLLTGPAGC
uniref:Toll-like receptor 13 n=1 Tax=Fundulus heteroclitus TaxID=8078 RepID=A0A3Q2QT80_FUNHE